MSYTVRFATDLRQPAQCIELASEDQAIAEAKRLAREGVANHAWAALRLADGLTFLAMNVNGEVEATRLAN
ncbi:MULTISPECIES: hypothetical protein [Derxia]|uniref:Uncharacterized protein n=1 Tax=Derxia gummosa DSM 723 TaxID=1121388 RepID=A0A8B6X346_9BURK|nr:MULTISPECIES: hypothetical protein [Derxia]